ncbi:MAG: methyltransferase regulatory domain-containing protein [Aridibacter famidurans]|nr:methyltransferase regulatory domain-containing protein [Aridibacter famidurans]
MQIAEAYDRMPYPSKFFYLTNPDHLATIATLFGIKPAPPEKCRVLELGCGNGSNLLAHAYTLPGSEFVGVDISSRHIDSAKTSIDDLGISNIEFAAMDVADLTADHFGKFDYIIGHGLISWIPVEVRDRIFEVCSELLDDKGIGFLSYNAYPGAYVREMVRDIFRYHTRNEDDLGQKVRDSVGLLALLAEGCIEPKVIKPAFRYEFQRHVKHDESDFYHDDLSDDYHPLYFTEFCSLLDRVGLQFLSEAEFHTMTMALFSVEVREFVESLDDLIEREQYLDFFRARVFRQSLFCRKEVEIDRSLEISRLAEMSVATTLAPEQEPLVLAPEAKVRFKGKRDQGIEIDHPLSKAALDAVQKAWGRAIPIKQLIQDAKIAVETAGIPLNAAEKEEATVMAIMLRIFQGSDLLDLHVYYPDAPQMLSERPRLNKLSRWQLGNSKNITSLFGLNVGIEDPVSEELLRLADGSRTIPELTSEMREFIHSLDDFDDREELLGRLETWVEESLEDLARLGVFEA